MAKPACREEMRNLRKTSVPARSSLGSGSAYPFSAASLTRVAKELPIKSWGPEDELIGFEEPGSQCVIMTFNCKTIVLLDSGTVEPYKGIAKLAAYTARESWKSEDAMIFTHKPFRNERLYHRFMVGTDNVMSEDVGQLVSPYAKKYFCYLPW